MRTTVCKLLAPVVALVALATPAFADITLDYGSMTNTANTFAGGVTSAGNIYIPVVVGVILFCAGIGVYYRLSGKAKIRS